MIAEEVGPNVFDLKCSHEGCRWQSFTWSGPEAARDLADRHRHAARLALTETGRKLVEASRDLIGYVGQ